MKRFWIVLLLLCAIGAAAALRRLVALQGLQPREVDQHFSVEATMVMIHIVPSLLFVILLPLQFVSSIRREHPRVHRWIGRLVMVTAITLGISALRLSWHPVGGLAEATATSFFGCYFLFSLAKAWWHIRQGRIAAHREWVTRMTAVALGVATTRPIIGFFFATSRLTGLTPQQFFGPAMWLGFVTTCMAGEAWIRSQSQAASGVRKSLREQVPV